jgi:glycosyltransferase involved in cell wall biosynthesis
MKIAQVAPDIYPLPPAYGGLERIVYDLTEELVRMGHDVYLYAPKGTQTSAKLMPYRHTDSWNFNEIVHYVMTTLPPSIDLIHDHTHISALGQLHLPIPTFCTIHIASPLTMADKVKTPIYVSRYLFEQVGHSRGFYVYNGLNPDDFDFSETKQDYLLFLGVLGWHKGIHHALEIAEKTKQNLIVAGPVHELEFYQNYVLPKIQRNKQIEYVGEVFGKRKIDLLKNAKCVLFPTECPEAFGLVLIEAMICGTPVLALANGAVPDVLQQFPDLVCYSAAEMEEKVRHKQFPSPHSLRQYVLSRFTARRMAGDYIQIYQHILSKNN